MIDGWTLLYIVRGIRTRITYAAFDEKEAAERYARKLRGERPQGAFVVDVVPYRKGTE